MKKAIIPVNRNALKGGSYSLILTAVVLAILIAVNILVSALPANWTKLDMSSSQLYSITSNTKAVLNNLQKDVKIYWLVQQDQEDSIIENLLAKYEGLSSHVDVVKKNPDVFPTFAEQYTSETVVKNSLIVECGETYRFVSANDFYPYEINYTTYEYVYSFDGERLITSAIDYVVSEDLPLVYLLEGHGEYALPSNFADGIEKDNIETAQLSLLTMEAVPEDADCIIIYSPASDISETEKEMLEAYVTAGGKLMVMAGPLEEGSLTNLNSLLANYGVTVHDGIVLEENRNHYFYGYPYLLLPNLQSNAITDALISSKYYVIMSLCNGLTIDGTGTGTVSSLLYTSDTAYAKTSGYALTTYDKEDGDIDGPFQLGVSIENESGGGIVWFTSGDFLEDNVNSYSSGANGDLAMNALSSLIGENEALTIRSKSLSYNYLTISESTADDLKLWMIGLIPLLFFGVGLAVVWLKRRKQNETI